MSLPQKHNKLITVVNMDLRIQFSNDEILLSNFEKLCEGYKQFQKNSLSRKELIDLFKEAKKEQLEEYTKAKQMMKDLQRNSLHSPKTMKVICSYCKRIKNEQGEWKITTESPDDLSQIALSHGVCPDCYKKEMDC
jgi:hypothetical protein